MNLLLEEGMHMVARDEAQRRMSHDAIFVTSVARDKGHIGTYSCFGHRSWFGKISLILLDVACLVASSISRSERDLPLRPEVILDHLEACVFVSKSY